MPENGERAPDKEPERDEERRPKWSWNSDRAVILLGTLTQVVALIGQISDLFGR
jgi:hypothetical protein